ncbi:MAG TPA: hypothetical protein VKB57_23620 [Acidimicrobiales bacterium]|nr:hypothetical protein [Acidimicrobiales bacterium]
MAGNPRIVVDFVSDTSGLKSGMAEASGATSGFGTKLKSLAKTGAIAAGAAGVGALIYTLKTGISEWQQSTKVAAQTQAVLKSTGSVANVTAQQVSDLATSIMKKTGIDDEAIASGENLLLTFTNIRDEVGKGNDVFTQATSIMTDMSVALGQDMATSAMQLGKALNDPVKGMTALRRVGVTFTQAQQDQVKAMVESGHTMEAQKLILGELRREFGGSAEAIGKTLPGQLAIVRESFNNFAGDLVAKAIPYVEQFISYLQRNWPAISAAISQGFQEIKPMLAAFGDALKALVPLVVAVVKVIKDNWDLIGPIIMANVRVMQDAFKVIADIFNVLAALLRGDWSAAWTAFKNLVSDMVTLMVDNIKRTLLPLLTILSVLWDGIKSAASTAWNGIKTLVTGVVDDIKTAVTNTWNTIKTTITNIVDSIKTALTSAWNTIKTSVTGVVDDIKTALTNAWNSIKTAVMNVVNTLKTDVTAAWNTLKTNVSTAINTLETTIKSSWNAISGAVKTAANAAETAVDGLKAAFNAAKSAASALDGVVSGLKGAFNAAKTAADSAGDLFKGALAAAAKAANSALGPLSGTASAIAGAMSAAAGAVNSLISAIKSIPSHINLPSIPGGGLLSKIPGLETGGIVSRPTLALIGEAGPEAVVPLGQFNALIRAVQQSGQDPGPPPIDTGRPLEVRVFIGDQELRGLVRTEVVTQQNRVAQTLLAGLT